MEVLILGDMHLERQKETFPKQLDIYNYQNLMLDQVIEYSRLHGNIPIIQTGDAFDSFNPTQESLEFLIKKIGATKAHWYFNLGNHCVAGEQNSLQALKAVGDTFKVNFSVFTKPTLEIIDGQKFIFLPWPYKRHPLLKEHKNAIVISHIEYNGTKLDNGKIYKHDGNENEISKHNFKSYGHFWAIGHLHSFQRGKNYVYCGSPLQLNFGENSDKCFLHFKVGSKVKYKRVEIEPGYILKNYEIRELKDINKAIKDLESNPIAWGKFHFFGNDFGFLGHPKVIQYKNLNKKAKTIEEEVITNQIDFNFNRLKLLKTELKKDGVSDKLIARTVKLAKQLEHSILER